MTTTEILSRLDGVKAAGADKWQARCPAHDDRKPSLSIATAGDRTLLHCQAGCQVEAVVEAMHATMADLFIDDTDTAPRPRIVAEYDYNDEQGTFLYQVVRYVPKDFRQRRPDGAGGWIWKLDDTRRVLYRLLQLQGKAAVVVVEGERDVATAEGWKLTATCNAMGAGKWRPEYADQLVAAGCKRVVVVPDSDGPGRAHADHVARSCHAAGLAVKVVTLDTGKDLTDYATMKTKADFVALVQATADFDPAAPRVNDKDDVNDQTTPSTPVSSFRSFMSSPGAWPELAPAAYVGLPGELVRIVGPHTEGDPAALIFTALAMFGNAIGRGPGFLVGADEHHTNLFGLLVGSTSTGRKGTVQSESDRVMAGADPDWARDCRVSGLSSGEGLIHAVRDALEAEEPIKEKGRIVGYQTVVKDPGIADKRCLVTESEFASVLRVAKREGSTLSPTVRQAWDTGTLRVLTKQTPERATGAHISIIGHITPEELQREMTGTDLANGFANRFLFVAARRSKLLPHGGRVDPMALAGLSRAFGSALTTARTRTTLAWDAGAEARWVSVYEALTSDRPGLAGAVTARAAPQVIRLALIYALLDESRSIALKHLDAALALWDYCAATATMVFGQRVGNQLADYLLAMMRESPTGLTRTAIRDALGRNRAADEIDAALDVLMRYGLATRTTEQHERGGRPAERWHAVTFSTPSRPVPTTPDSVIADVEDVVHV